MTTLLDTSALAKLLVEEDESGALRAFLLAQAAAGERFYISTLAITELRRLAIRIGIDSAQADDVLARFSVIRLSESVLQLAGRLPARQLGTLDAIHLATALTIESTSLVTYDRRQADAAHREGMRVDVPGP